MKGLYKITAFFLLVFSIGIYISVLSINSFFNETTSKSIITVTSNSILKSTQVLVINFINN